MATIKQSCPCGAKMWVEDKCIVNCGWRAKEWLDAHSICRKNHVIRRLEDEDSNEEQSPLRHFK
jgi:hypothetical protein